MFLNKKGENSFEQASSEQVVFWDLTDTSAINGSIHESKYHLKTHLNLLNQKSPMQFDGKSCWLNTSTPLLRTDKSFTIIAWVSIDLDNSNSKVTLPDGINAATAVSQESELVSAFHLGIRSQNDGITKTIPRWCFTLSPEQGELDPLGCQDVYSKKHLNSSALNKFFLIAGVCNYESLSLHLYLPQANESTSIILPKAWKPWHSNNQTVIGRGRWEGKSVDMWSGCIKGVSCYSRALNERDIFEIYNKTSHLLNNN